MREEPQEVDLLDFAEEPRRHLRACWEHGVPLVVSVDGQPLVVENLADLEVLHAALEGHTD